MSRDNVQVRVLILGGGHFLGRAVAVEGVARGWKVGTFNRRRTSAKLEGVTSIQGDRTVASEIRALADIGTWDAVVDTSAYEPAHVHRSATALRDSAAVYAVVSSLTVYAGWPAGDLTEESPVRVGRADHEAASPEITNLPHRDRFGTLKAGCEQAVKESFGQSALLLRPGLIVGPHERKGRLPWWLHRVSRGGQMLVPGRPERLIQMLDVRDLAKLLLDLIAAEVTGPMNATGEPVSWRTFLAACSTATGVNASPVWADDRWLESMGVRPLRDVPLWQASPGAWNVTSARAVASGFARRRMSGTIADTWAWLRSETPEEVPFGLDPNWERQLLSAWRESQAASPERS